MIMWKEKYYIKFKSKQQLKNKNTSFTSVYYGLIKKKKNKVK